MTMCEQRSHYSNHGDLSGVKQRSVQLSKAEQIIGAQHM